MRAAHNARVFEFQGEQVTLAQLSAKCGVSKALLYDRIVVRGKPVAESATRPKRPQSRPGGRLAANVPRPCPAFKKHVTGRAFARWKMKGKLYERYFGRHGSPEALAAYRKFAADWAVGNFEPASIKSAGGASVADLATRWMAHCNTTYVKDGKPSSEVKTCLAAARALIDQHGDTLAADFAPAKLRAVRDGWVERKLCRNTCNAYTSRVVRCFAWGASHSLVPAAVHGALALVEQLAPGRTVAHDNARRKPVSEAVVEATIACLAPADEVMRARLAAMIRLQRLTGMRPGEICTMKGADVDRAGDVWRYLVARHKNTHRGKVQAY